MNLFNFQSTGASLENISLELMLLDWDRVTKNEVGIHIKRDVNVLLHLKFNHSIKSFYYVEQVIGRLELGGPRCAGAAQNHWNEVCNSPRRQIAEWHKLSD